MPANCRFAMAVHTLALLAREGGTCRTSEEIARSTNTHPVVVRRIIGALSEAGLLETHKGPRGGAKLTRCPKAMSLGEIYRSVEVSQPFGLHHTEPNHECPIGAGIEEVLQNVLESATKALERELDKTSLADVLDRVMKSHAACIEESKTG